MFDYRLPARTGLFTLLLLVAFTPFSAHASVLYQQRTSSASSNPHVNAYLLEQHIHTPADNTWDLRRIAIRVEIVGHTELTVADCKTADISFVQSGGAWNGRQNNINPFGDWAHVYITADNATKTCTYTSSDGNSLMGFSAGVDYDMVYTSRSGYGEAMRVFGTGAGVSTNTFGAFFLGDEATVTYDASVGSAFAVLCDDVTCDVGTVTSSTPQGVLINHAQGGTVVQAPNFIGGGIPPGIAIPHTLINSLPDGTYYAVVFFEGLTGCPSTNYHFNSFIPGSYWGYDAINSAVQSTTGGGCLQDFHIDPNKDGPWQWGALSNTGMRNAIADNAGIPAFAICDSYSACNALTPITPVTGPSSVMFLPGIEASRLYRPDYSGGTDRLWEPTSDADAQDMGLDQAGKSIRDDIYTRDVIDTSYAPSGPNIYSSFITSLNAFKNSPAGIADWEAIPYDWRLSLDDILTNGRNIDGRIYYAGPLGATSTPYIIQELRRLAATSKSGKVTIVAHSNGGLVAKRLTQVLGEAEASKFIDKIIFVDVPQLGTPMAVAALLHGTDQGIPVTLSEKAARHFAQNAPMTYNLLPSSQYFTQTDDPVITFDPAKLPDWASRYGDVHSTERLQNFILDTTRTQPAVDDVKTPEIGNSALYSASNATHASLDAWTPPNGVKLYLVNGWGIETLSSIAYTKVPVCTGRSLLGFCTTTYSDSLTIKPTHVVDGDGTVLDSSAMWGNGNTGAERYWVNLRQFNLDNHCLFRYCKDHKSILEVQDLRNLIQNIMLGNSTSPFGYTTTTAPTANSTDNRLHFTLHSPLSLGFTDSSGNYSGAQGTTAVFNTPDITYERYGDVQWLSIPKTLAGKVVLHGEASGTFSLGVEEQTGNSIVSTTSFEGIPSATSTIAQLVLDGSTSPTSAGTLQVDYDGNGTTDYSLSSKLGGVVVPPTKPLTLTPDSKVITLGNSLPVLTYTLSGFVDGDTVTSSTSRGAICTTTATPNSSVGSYPITCTQGTLVSGKYYVANTAIGTLKILYRFDGFLQPINDTAHQVGQSTSVFKGGSTVPVKLQLKNASGTPQQASTAPLWLTPQKGSAMSALVDESVYSDPATTGTTFKWDATTQQYQYNWNTKGFVAGYWYKISVKSPDSSVYSVTVGLK